MLKTLVEKWLKIDRKTSKFSPISVNISAILFEVEKFWQNQSFEKLQVMKLGPNHVFHNEFDMN